MYAFFNTLTSSTMDVTNLKFAPSEQKKQREIRRLAHFTGFCKIECALSTSLPVRPTPLHILWLLLPAPRR